VINLEDAILVGLDTGKDYNLEDSLLELSNLAVACEVNVLLTITQKRDTPSPEFYVGSGKVQEILEAINTLDANLVIFNDELSPSHIRNLEKALDIKVIDRTVLILDIFAKRAKTKEAMLQVELAQAKYFLPRIVGAYKYLSRQKSGTGSKGPGEQQLELDRRLLRNKISKLKNDLKALVKIRRTQREQRQKNDVFTVALTGYTNAGKSTLMNSIIDITSVHQDKYVFEKNMLFATLETKSKKIILDNRREFLLTDTVGFIDKLPHNLIEAFKSTLEEITEASLILHVIDISNKDYEKHIQIVDNVLKDLGVHSIPIIYVYNKIDLKEEQHIDIKDDSIFISAINNTNVNGLIKMIDNEMRKLYQKVRLFIPFAESEAFSNLQKTSNIIESEYLDNGIDVTAELDVYHFNKFKKYIK